MNNYSVQERLGWMPAPYECSEKCAAMNAIRNKSSVSVRNVEYPLCILIHDLLL